MKYRKPRKQGQPVHNDRTVTVPLWLLEDIQLELTRTHGLCCTDRPDTIPPEHKDLYWKLNHSRTLHRLIGCICLEAEKREEVMEMKVEIQLKPDTYNRLVNIQQELSEQDNKQYSIDDTIAILMEVLKMG